VGKAAKVAAAAAFSASLLLAAGSARAGDDGAAPGKEESGLRSVVGPKVPRGMTRVRGTVRPFLSVLGQGGGAIADLGVDHYFARIPLRLSLEIEPLALAIEADGPGSIGHYRLGAGYAGDYIELGLAVGSRIQNYGGAGLSLAGYLRLGALDGLKFTLSYGYVVKRNQYTGDVGVGLSNVLAHIQVPLGARLAVFTEAGVSSDRWIYASMGLRHRLIGDGGGGTWFVSGSFGVAWVVDRPECIHPETGWCENSAWAAGPTLGFGLERRF
jgi:hypothetical protein